MPASSLAGINKSVLVQNERGEVFVPAAMTGMQLKNSVNVHFQNRRVKQMSNFRDSDNMDSDKAFKLAYKYIILNHGDH